MDRKSNAAFYGSASITPEQIFRSPPRVAPDVANNFVQTLTAQTRRLPHSSTIQASNTSSTGNNSATPAKVKTYGVGDPDAPDAGDMQFNEDF
jgi:hypothetical protein